MEPPRLKRGTHASLKQVLLGSGERVRFLAGTDVEYVARLVAALEHKSC